MPELHTSHWFDAAFEVDGHTVPPQLRRLSERFCREFGVNGSCDPMYIANVAAVEFGMGDGRSSFQSVWTDPEPAAVDRLAKRLMFSYSTCIGERATRVRPLLDGALAGVEVNPCDDQLALLFDLPAELNRVTQEIGGLARAIESFMPLVRPGEPDEADREELMLAIGECSGAAGALARRLNEFVDDHRALDKDRADASFGVPMRP